MNFLGLPFTPISSSWWAEVLAWQCGVGCLKCMTLSSRCAGSWERHAQSWALGLGHSWHLLSFLWGYFESCWTPHSCQPMHTAFESVLLVSTSTSFTFIIIFIFIFNTIVKHVLRAVDIWAVRSSILSSLLFIVGFILAFHDLLLSRGHAFAFHIMLPLFCSDFPLSFSLRCSGSGGIFFLVGSNANSGLMSITLVCCLFWILMYGRINNCLNWSCMLTNNVYSVQMR